MIARRLREHTADLHDALGLERNPDVRKRIAQAHVRKCREALADAQTDEGAAAREAFAAVDAALMEEP